MDEGSIEDEEFQMMQLPLPEDEPESRFIHGK